MKTHELAKYLNQLARILRTGPNIELGDLSLENPGASLLGNASGDQQMVVNLNTLVALSRIGKDKWLGLIEENGFDIKVRGRDSARDVMWKVVRLLEKDQSARRKIQERASSSKASPELVKALKSLLNDD